MFWLFAADVSEHGNEADYHSSDVKQSFIDESDDVESTISRISTFERWQPDSNTASRDGNVIIQEESQNSSDVTDEELAALEDSPASSPSSPLTMAGLSPRALVNLVAPRSNLHLLPSPRSPALSECICAKSTTSATAASVSSPRRAVYQNNNASNYSGLPPTTSPVAAAAAVTTSSTGQQQQKAGVNKPPLIFQQVPDLRLMQRQEEDGRWRRSTKNTSFSAEVMAENIDKQHHLNRAPTPHPRKNQLSDV